MSGDLEQDYFSDGITEDIIAELGKFREFLVIARASSFQFRGKANDVGRGGEEASQLLFAPCCGARRSGGGRRCNVRRIHVGVAP